MPKRVQAELPMCGYCHDTVSYPAVMCGGAEGCQSSYHEGCIDQWLSQNTTCPMCRCEFVKVPNRSLNNILECLEQPCINAERGCDVILPIKERFKHQRKCKYRREACRGAKFGCQWHDIVANRRKHEKKCVYKKFEVIPQEVDKYQQLLDEYAQQSLQATQRRADSIVERIEQHKASLTNTLSLYSRLGAVFNTGHTKRFLQPFKNDTRLLRINQGTRDLHMHLVCADDTLSVELSGGTDDTYPLAMLSVVFLLNTESDIVGDKSTVHSFLLSSPEQRQTVLSVKCASFTPKTALSIKLTAKIF